MWDAAKKVPPVDQVDRDGFEKGAQGCLGGAKVVQGKHAAGGVVGGPGVTQDLIAEHDCLVGFKLHGGGQLGFHFPKALFRLFNLVDRDVDALDVGQLRGGGGVLLYMLGAPWRRAICADRHLGRRQSR